MENFVIILDNEAGLAGVRGVFSEQERRQIAQIKATFKSTDEQDYLALDLPDGTAFNLGLTDHLARCQRQIVEAKNVQMEGVDCGEEVVLLLRDFLGKTDQNKDEMNLIFCPAKHVPK